VSPLPFAPRGGISGWSRRYRGLTLLLTFLCYTSYHLSRKPISIVKVPGRGDTLGTPRGHPGGHPGESLGTPCRDPRDTLGTTWGHPGENGDNYKELFGALDNAFLVAYAVGMFVSGIFGERLPLRYYLSSGMLLSGLFTALFGLGYFWNIHVLWYFIIIQICNGLVQTTGWPAVVACVGNWFGKGKRGLIMGIWNSHTSVGNILGSLIAGAWVSSAWGLSFVVPGVIIASVGLICFFFLVEREWRPRLRMDVPELPVLAGAGGDVGKPASITAKKNLPKLPWNFWCWSFGPAAISFLGALRIPGVVEFSLCLLFAKLVSYTFLYWLPLYIVNVAHFGAKEAGDLSTLFDVGGILGGIIAGLVSDYTGGRATTCCVMLVVAAPMVGGVTPVALSPPAMLIVCGGLVNGPYALITTAVSADLGTHESLQGNAKALSTVTAIIDGTGSVGAALGPLLAGLISPTGWNNVFYMLITADVLACLVGARVPARGRDLGWCHWDDPVGMAPSGWCHQDGAIGLAPLGRHRWDGAIQMVPLG
uniref:Glucose-6-phosphate exchanger SLC37A2 n=1 Tax=Nothoprocta perdicaria TaxID=30464 RepID=A0A8C7E958_NOTPE